MCGLIFDKYLAVGRIEEMPVKEKRGPVYMASDYLPVYPSARRKLSLVRPHFCLKYIPTTYYLLYI